MIAAFLLARGTIVVGRVVGAVRIRVARAVSAVSITVTIFRGGPLLLPMGLISLVLLFDHAYKALAVDQLVQVLIGLINTALDVRLGVLIPGAWKHGHDDMLEECIVLKFALLAEDMDFVPGLLELCEMVQNVRALSSPSLKDDAKMLSIVSLRRSLEHALKCLVHLVGADTAFSVNIELVGDVVGDTHLSAGVVIVPVLGSDGIACRVRAWKSAIDVLLDVDHLNKVVHEARPRSPIA